MTESDRPTRYVHGMFVYVTDRQTENLLQTPLKTSFEYRRHREALAHKILITPNRERLYLKG